MSWLHGCCCCYTASGATPVHGPTGTSHQAATNSSWSWQATALLVLCMYGHCGSYCMRAYIRSCRHCFHEQPTLSTRK
jgi:hypothetical protein